MFVPTFSDLNEDNVRNEMDYTFNTAKMLHYTCISIYRHVVGSPGDYSYNRLSLFFQSCCLQTHGRNPSDALTPYLTFSFPI